MSGGCCKWPDQRLQEVQPLWQCGAAKTHLAQSLLQQQQLINCCTLSLHQPVLSPSSVCQCHLNFAQINSGFSLKTLSRPKKKNISETFIAKKPPQLLSNSKPKPSPPNFTSSVLASPFSAGRLSFVCSWFVSSVCFPLGPFFPFDGAFLSSDLSYNKIHFQ